VININMISRLLVFVFLLSIQSLMFNIAQAETKNKNEPHSDIKTDPVKNKQPKNKQFQDWVYQCGAEGLKDDKCYIMQNIFIKESGLRLLGVAIGYVGPNKSPWLLLTIPLGVFLPAGMSLDIDGGEEIKIPLRICLPDGCTSSIKLDKNLLTTMKKGSKANVVFVDGKTQKQIKVVVSLTGFTRAFLAL